MTFGYNLIDRISFYSILYVNYLVYMLIRNLIESIVFEFVFIFLRSLNKIFVLSERS